MPFVGFSNVPSLVCLVLKYMIDNYVVQQDTLTTELLDQIKKIKFMQQESIWISNEEYKPARILENNKCHIVHYEPQDMLAYFNNKLEIPFKFSYTRWTKFFEFSNSSDEWSANYSKQKIIDITDMTEKIEITSGQQTIIINFCQNHYLEPQYRGDLFVRQVVQIFWKYPNETEKLIEDNDYIDTITKFANFYYHGTKIIKIINFQDTYKNQLTGTTFKHVTQYVNFISQSMKEILNSKIYSFSLDQIIHQDRCDKKIYQWYNSLLISERTCLSSKYITTIKHDPNFTLLFSRSK